MKFEEKKLARNLRLKGLSMNEILQFVKVSKSSISLWVRDIQLTTEQKKELSKTGIKKEIIERRRATRLAKENFRRQIIVENAKKILGGQLSKRELLLIGAMLYWAEGGKTKMLFRFSNSDPLMIKLIMKFLRKICKIPEQKFRGYIHIHPHLDAKKAEEYWSDIAGIPLNQFYKTYRKSNKSSKNKKDSLPFGTLDVYVCSANLFLTVKGWIEQISTLAEKL